MESPAEDELHRFAVGAFPIAILDFQSSPSGHREKGLDSDNREQAQILAGEDHAIFSAGISARTSLDAGPEK